MKIRMDDGFYSDIESYMTFHGDGSGGDEFTLSTHQNMKPSIEQAKRRARELRDNPQKKSGAMIEVAEIPMGLIYEWLQKENLDIFNPAHDNRLRRKLDSKDFAFLRTGGGTLGQRTIK